MNKKTIGSEGGMVSLFIVISTTLLLTVITLSFAQLMMKDQRQATLTDLSQSAYDSATAGVEDAKRALLLEQSLCSSGAARCDQVRGAINQQQCNTLAAIYGNASDKETMIQQSEGANGLDQAYTCVKIQTNTPTYIGTLQPDTAPTLVPLVGTKAFDRVVLRWFKPSQDVPASTKLDLPTTTNLPPVSAWPAQRPSLLRVQLVQYGQSFQLSDFDGSSDTATVFLYPSSLQNLPVFSLTGMQRPGKAIDKPQQATCRQTEFQNGGYACSMILGLPKPVNPGPNGERTAFLSLSAFYGATDFSVELWDGTGSQLDFAGVQPMVDATGRANDVFRRVQARVELGDQFNYPLAAIDTNGNLCKDFRVTNDPGDYKNNCTP